jgi:outer membrane protein assembly factor BamE (lipoprotein component of BamABCDE complex)
MQVQVASRGCWATGAFAGSRLRALLAGCLAVAVLLVMAACTPLIRDHGFAPTEAELATLEIGVDTRDTVAQKVGRPSAEGLLEDSGWFYVQSRWEHIGPRAPVEVERQVVVISFNEGGTVSNVERFGLEDGRVVALSRRVTDSNIQGVTLVGQLLGNIGRLRADQLVE